MVASFALVCVGFHWFSDQGWVPILDSANPALHEAGHPLVGKLSQTLMVYGGTLLPLLFPAAAAWHFIREGNPSGVAIAVVWLGENRLNIVRYMADARTQVLPLVGGGDHDWTEIFSRWGLLAWDERNAGLTHGIGVLLMVGATIWLALRWHAGTA